MANESDVRGQTGKSWRLRLLAVLLMVALACNMPTWSEIEPELDLPTPAPTLAPEDLQPTPTAPEGTQPVQQDTPTAPPGGDARVYPRVFHGTAQSTAYGSSNGACQSTAQVTLTIHSGGRTQISATGPQFFDHINCTPTDAQITWLIEGMADERSAEADFTTCNNGGFNASGNVNYKDGELTGQVSCTNTEGQLAVTLVIGR